MSEREDILALSKEALKEVLKDLFAGESKKIIIPTEGPEDRWREFLK